MRFVQLFLILIPLFIFGCSSSNDNEPAPAAVEEIHTIAPADVDAYIADFETRAQRTGLLFDGIEQKLVGVEQLEDDDAFVFAYADDDTILVVLGFDFETEKPLRSVQILFTDGDEISRNLQGQNDAIAVSETAEEDLVYSGRVTDLTTQEEFDVVVTINEALFGAGSSTVELAGTDAILNGDLGTRTYIQIRDMINANPDVTRVVIQNSSGSVNDDINVHTGRLIRAAGLATHVPANGDINSGAVDLFAAGLTRTVVEGGILGVHSWCCNDDGLAGDMIPKDDAAHGTQLTYFREMLGDKGEDFYFFTLQAAPFDGIHAMTQSEMILHGLIPE